MVKSMGTLEYFSPNERDAINHLKEALHEWLGNDIVKVMLFGARIKNKHAEGKDIDVLIIVRNINQKKIDRITLIVMDVNMEYNIFFTQMVYDEAEFNDPVHQASPIIKKILLEAVII